MASAAKPFSLHSVYTITEVRTKSLPKQYLLSKILFTRNSIREGFLFAEIIAP